MGFYEAMSMRKYDASMSLAVTIHDHLRALVFINLLHNIPHFFPIFYALLFFYASI
jgi:hypothetical protein